MDESFPSQVHKHQNAYDRDEIMNLPLPHHVNAIMPAQDSQNQYKNPFQDSALGDITHAYDTPIMPGSMPSSYMDYAFLFV
jgi:hypothetical protein